MRPRLTDEHPSGALLLVRVQWPQRWAPAPSLAEIIERTEAAISELWASHYQERQAEIMRDTAPIYRAWLAPLEREQVH